MNPLREARETVAEALTGLAPFVYPHPADAPSFPCIMVAANESADGWFVQSLKGGTGAVQLVARVAVQKSSGNEKALDLIETIAWSVARTMNVRGSAVQAPRSEDVGTTPCFIVDLPITVHVEE